MSATRPIASPNLPTAPNEYQQQFQDQFTNILRLYHNTVTTSVNAPYPFGSFYSSVAQTNPVINTQNLMTLNHIDYGYHISLGGATDSLTPPSYSRIYVADTGVYNIQFSAQIDKTGGGADSMYIWLRINGSNAPNTAGKVVVNGPNDEKIAGWNYVVVLTANDYVELAWSSADIGMFLASPVAAGPVPAIPSLIVTVVWVSNLPL